MLVRGVPQLSIATLAAERFIVTGTGSSEAHARYLCTLINLYTERTATYLPLSALAATPSEVFVDKALVVFSQGISPNARPRSAAMPHFRTRFCSPPQPRPPPAPPVNSIRRTCSTICSTVAAISSSFPSPRNTPRSSASWARSAVTSPACSLPPSSAAAASSPPSPSQILPLLDMAPPPDLLEAVLDRPESFAQGFNLVTAAPISDFAQNLACKFMEGLFWPCPPISDFLQFAHGPFQQMTAHPHPVVILQGDSPAEAELVRRSVGMLLDVGLEAYVIHVDAPPLHSIFGFEAALNRLVFAALQRFGVDQVNWPGKGRDDLLYGFSPNR
jgi:hypothetical protein